MHLRPESGTFTTGNVSRSYLSRLINVKSDLPYCMHFRPESRIFKERNVLHSYLSRLINVRPRARYERVTRAARVVMIQAARVCCNMPSSEDLVHLLLLSENSILKRRVVRGCKRGIKRWGVHPINRRRRVYGEYHHLIKQLKEDPERFFQYTRMSVPTFDFILNRLKGRLEKKRIGSRGSCSSAILNRLKTVERSMTHLSVERRTKTHCRSPLKSIVTPLFTFARQHMGPDCKAVAERCRSNARRSPLVSCPGPYSLTCLILYK
ncbi:hypothetical protein J6590_028751 [Homalodisca vitripennis]|nr:hypothetical protein J6590_028751 [Homalodisca vitripennis]